MFRIISLFVAVCSVDRAQMSGMGMAFMKALSCLSLQRTGCRSSVNQVVTALPPFFCIYRWMFVTVNLHLFKKRFFLHFQVLIPHFLNVMFACFFFRLFNTREKNYEKYGNSENTEVKLIVGARCYLIMKAVFNSILFAETFEKREEKRNLHCSVCAGCILCWCSSIDLYDTCCDWHWEQWCACSDCINNHLL